jgi:hypothetical protein
MSPKVSPNDYAINDSPDYSLEIIQSATESAFREIGLGIEKSEIWKNGIVAVHAKGKLGTKNVKSEFFSKKKDNQILFKLNGDFQIKDILSVPEPRDCNPAQDNCAVFMTFWDSLLQKLNLPGREDIGKPRTPMGDGGGNAVKIVEKQSEITPKIESGGWASADEEIMRSFNKGPEIPKSSYPSPPAMPSTPAKTDLQKSIDSRSFSMPSPQKPTVSSSLTAGFDMVTPIRDQEPVTLAGERIPPIENEYNPFLIDKIGESPYYWKLPAKGRANAPEIVKTFGVNLAVDGFTGEDAPDLDPFYTVYSGKGRFGPDKLTITIVGAEKDNNVYIRFLGKGLKLEDATRPDIRKANPDKNQAAYFVKLCDSLCKDLKIPLRESFGGAMVATTSDTDTGSRSKGPVLSLASTEMISSYQRRIIPQYQAVTKADGYLRQRLEQIDPNSDSILAEYAHVRGLLEKNTRWPLRNLTAIKLMLHKYPAPYGLVFIDVADIKSTQLFPVIVTVAFPTPKPVVKDIFCGYKGVWMTRDNDDVSQKITKYLNNEYPSLDNAIQKLFKEDYIHHFADNEIIQEGKRQSKIKIEQIIHEPIKVLYAENNQHIPGSYVFFSFFLKPESQGFQGIRPPGEVMQIYEAALEGLARFFIISDEEVAASASAQKSAADANKVNKCPKCGWILSPGKFKCPMCKFDSTLVGNVAVDSFSASEAVKGAKEGVKATALIGSIDEVLGGMDDEARKAHELLRIKFKEMVKTDKAAHGFLREVDFDSNQVEARNQDILYSLKQDLDFDIIPIQYIEINTQELMYPRAVVVLSNIKPEIIDYHIPLVSYLVEVPMLPEKIVLNKALKFIASGDDWGFCNKLNKSEDFMSFFKDIYGGQENAYTSTFHAKKKDLIGRVVAVEGLDFELPWVVAIRPFIRGGKPDSFVVALHHFIRSEAEEYAGQVPLSKTLVALDAIVTGIDMVRPKEEIIEQVEKPTQEAPKSAFASLADEMDKVLGDSPILDLAAEMKIGAESGAITEKDEMDSIFGEAADEGVDLTKPLMETPSLNQFKAVTGTAQSDLDFNFDFSIPPTNTPNASPPQTNINDFGIDLLAPTTPDPITPPQQSPNFDFNLGIAPPSNAPRMAPKIPAPPPRLPEIPPILGLQCQKAGMDPNMNGSQINQKLLEVQFQIQNMLEMKQQLSQAFTAKTISMDQYMQQDSQLVSYLEQFEQQEKILKEMKQYRP